MPDARFSEDFWTDPKIKALDMDTQRLFIYLFTNPHRNYCGLYYLPKSFIREQTGLSDRAIDRGMHTLQEGLFIEYSEEYQVVFVKNMLKRQAPGYINDKQIKGITNHLNRLHRCYLIKSFLEHYKSLNITVSYTPIHTPMDVQSQSISQSQSQSVKDNAHPKNLDAPATPFFSCAYFSVDLVYREKLSAEYPLLNDQRLSHELSKMEDWLSDNKGRKKFGANGKMKNPKLFIKNWLDKMVVTQDQTERVNEPKGYAGIREFLKEG